MIGINPSVILCIQIENGKNMLAQDLNEVADALVYTSKHGFNTSQTEVLFHGLNSRPSRSEIRGIARLLRSIPKADEGAQQADEMVQRAEGPKIEDPD